MARNIESQGLTTLNNTDYLKPQDSVARPAAIQSMAGICVTATTKRSSVVNEFN